MMSTASYFQFPLCALAFGNTEKERLDHIISLGCFEAGHEMVRKLPPALRRERAEQVSALPDLPWGFKKTDPNHLAAMVGAKSIGVVIGSLHNTSIQWKQLSDFRSAFESTHGRDAEVRITKDLIFEARDNCGISYRELAVLCAVYSWIGAKASPVRITRLQIQARMLGYKSQKVLRLEMQKRTDGAVCLTERQINLTLDKLHERRFFSRARANKRQTFYSNRLTQDELEDALIRGKTYKQAFHNHRRERDAALMDKIKKAKAAIKAPAPIKVDAEHTSGSKAVRLPSAGSSAEQCA